jgi:DNA-binding transcriptional LysR family regulator
MILDLRNLRCAIAAAETGSFRRAAEMLALSQSSLSRRIQHLEHRLGFPLFKRSRTGVSPTTAGAAFLERAMAGAQQLDLAARYAVAVDSGEAGQVRVGVASSRTGGLFGEVLRKFKALFPSVNIALMEDTTSKMSHKVAMGTLDVAFLIGADCNPVCETRVLWREAILAALGNTHRLFNHQVLTWQDTRDDTILLSKAEQGSEVQHQIIAKLTKGGHRPKIDIQDVSEASVFDLVVSGCGITFVDESAARRVEGLRFIPLAGESDALPASAIWRSDNANPAVLRLIAIAEAVGRGGSKA